MVGVEVDSSGHKAVVCLDRLVVSSFRLFTPIALGGRVRLVFGFRWGLRSTRSDGRSSKSLMISSGWLISRSVVQDVGDRWRSIKIGVNWSVQEGSGRLDLMLRPSPRRSQGRSLLVELSGRKEVRSSRPSCRATLGQHLGIR